MYKDKIIELCIFHIDEKDNRIGELQAEIKELKENMGNYPTDRYDFKCIEENTKLKAELKTTKDNGLGILNEMIELKADNVRLMSQVGSDSSNSSSTHTHTIKKEIAEYMDHNPKSKGVRMFILPIEEFNGGERDGYLYWDDGME